MECPECHKENFVYSQVDLSDFTKKDWNIESAKRKFYCHRCKYAFDENKIGNTI